MGIYMGETSDPMVPHWKETNQSISILEKILGELTRDFHSV